MLQKVLLIIFDLLVSPSALPDIHFTVQCRRQAVRDVGVMDTKLEKGERVQLGVHISQSGSVALAVEMGTKICGAHRRAAVRLRNQTNHSTEKYAP